MVEKKKSVRRIRNENKYSDLALLLKVAGESGVSILELEGVTVKFFRPEPIPEEITQALQSSEESQALHSSEGILPPSITQHSQDQLLYGATAEEPSQEVVVSEEDRARLEEIEHEQLMLDDPLAFEEDNIHRLMGNSVHA